MSTKPKAQTVVDAGRIVINKPARASVVFPIKQIDEPNSCGLMTQAMSVAKGKRIIAKELGESVQKKIRSLDDEYEEAFYRNEKGEPCIKASAIMRAMLDATVDLSIAKTQVKRALRVQGDLYIIHHKKVTRDERVVIRKGMTKAPNIACRPIFHDWSIDVHISYDPNLISEEQIINLLDLAGTQIGIGSYRPQCTGNFGQFQVDTKKMNTPKWKASQKKRAKAA